MDTALFIAAKLAGLALTVETWLLAGVVLALVGRLLRWPRLARRAGWTTAVAFVAIACLPLHHPMLRWLETRHPVLTLSDLPPLAGVVVLGGGELPELSQFWGQAQLTGSGERIVFGAAVAQAQPQARLIHTGGSGRLADLGREFLSEAQVAQGLYLALGIAPDRIELEERARNTAENARAALVLARSRPSNGPWLLVTSAAHMPRALGSFAAAGWQDMVPFPVDFRSGTFRQGVGWNPLGHISQLNATLHEILGLLVNSWRDGRG